MLGFHPQASVVLIGITSGRLGPLSRIDIADVEHEPVAIGHHLGLVLAVGQVSECVLVVVDDAEPAWLHDFADGVEAGGVRVTGGWQVGAEHYWPLADPDRRSPLSEIASSSVAAQFVLAGYSPVAARTNLAAGLAPYPDALRARLAAKAACLDAHDAGVDAIWAWCGLLGDPGIRPPRPSQSKVLPRPLTDKVTANLLAAIADAPVRDAMLAAAVHPDQPYEVCMRMLTGEEDHWERAAETGPDPDRVDAAVEALTHLARASSGAAAAQPLAMLAHVYWWMGEGTMANVAVDLAVDADPSHSLAGLLARALEVGMPPPWRMALAPSWLEGV